MRAIYPYTYIRVNYYREMCVVLVRGHNQPIHAAFSRKSIRIEVAGSSTRLVRTHRYFTTTRHARLEEENDERKETTLLLGSIT
jgi:hypothetical protein